MIALALAIPFLFLHVKYQPGVRVPLGSTHLGLELSDLAVVVVAVVALRDGLRHGFGRLRPAVWLWVSAALLLVWIFVRSQSLTHFVTAAKFAEYALLAVSLPLILRRRSQWEVVAAVIIAWSVAASFVGLLQIFAVANMHQVNIYTADPAEGIQIIFTHLVRYHRSCSNDLNPFLHAACFFH